MAGASVYSKYEEVWPAGGGLLSVLLTKKCEKSGFVLLHCRDAATSEE